MGRECMENNSLLSSAKATITEYHCYSIFLTQTGWGAANMSSPHPLPRKQELWPRHRQERRKRGEHPRDGKRARASHP